MSHGRRGLVSSLLLAGVLGCSDSPGPGVGSIFPDIVLVSIDSLRADHLGCYGYWRPTSPTIDRLASRGARFANAVTTTSWTLPAHAALFTGLNDAAHGVMTDGIRLADDHVTLAEELRGAGYQTAGFFGGPYLHPTFGLDQGFDTYQSCMTRIADDVTGRDVRAEALGGEETSHGDITGPRLLEEVEGWLDQVSEDPFFLFLHMWDVHYDYIPPQRLVEAFDPDYQGSITGRGMMHNQAISAEMDQRDLEHLLALYDGEIRFTDEILGQVLERLDARGRLEGTLIVVTADHGEEFFEHGGKGHRRTLFDEVLRVPLVVYWPGHVAPGQVIEDQVRIIDVSPTLLSLAGVASTGQLQGRDLTALLTGQTLEPAPALGELRRRRGILWTLRTNAEKALLAPDGRFVRFDLSRDPSEKRALAGRDPAGRASRRRLEAAIASAEEASASSGGVPIALPGEIRKQLEELGYLEEASPTAP